MSRITPEAPRRLPVPRSSISPQREGLDISARGTWASRGGWDFWAIARTNEPEPTKSFLEFAALYAFGYLGLVLGSGRGGELRVDAMEEFFGKKSAPPGSVKLLDTSVLIDGRIADICEAQFLEGVL